MALSRPVTTVSNQQYQRARGALEAKVRQGLAKKDTARYLVEDLLQFPCTIAQRYKHLDVIGILQENCSSENPGIEALIHGLSILERYGKNLLRTERPQQWRVIRLSNSVFRLEVDIIKGSRSILRLLGYTTEIQDGLSYPPDCLIPDVPKVASVTADVLILRVELHLLANGTHVQERQFYSYIPEGLIRAVQQFRRGANQMPEPPASLPGFPNLSMLNPPTYEAVLQGAGKKFSLETLGASDLSALQPITNISEPVSNNFDQLHETEESMPLQPTEDIKEEMLCDLCGQTVATLRCERCDQIFCSNCDALYHNNPKRRNHKREKITEDASARDVPEVPGSSSFNRISLESRLSNGLPSSIQSRSSIAPSQEESGPGGHGLQPTLSGERLRPTLNSRPSNSDMEGQWTRRVNLMATDLMDLIADPEAQRKRLMECLEELDKEAEKYKNGIKTLMTKAGKETSLVLHFKEKLTKIDDVKMQLKVLCGYEDPPQLQVPQPMESWSFRSVDPSSNPSINSSDITVPLQVAELPASEPNLIDLTSEEQPGLSLPSETTGSFILGFRTGENFNVAVHGSEEGGKGDMRTSRLKARSATEDPDLQSVFSPLTPAQDEQPHTNLKRNLENGKGESHPAKLQRGCTGNEIASQFENMNIEMPPEKVRGELPQHHTTELKFGEDSETEEVYHSADEGGTYTPPSIMVQNRLEQPIPKSQPMLMPLSAEDLQDRIKKEEIRFQTTQFLDLLRAADTARFRPEQVEFALRELDKEGNSNRLTPNAWIERNWENHVKSFITFVKEKGYKIAPENAEDVLLEGDQNFGTGYDLIVKAELEQIEEIAEAYSISEAKRAMKQAKGDKYHAWAVLQKDAIKQVFREFDEEEDETDEDIVSLKRVHNITDCQRQTNVYTAVFEFDAISRAETVRVLFNEIPDDMRDILLEDAIEAATGDEVVDFEMALHYLDNECMICTEKFPRSKITCLPTCGDNECKYCITCLETHLTICIRDKNIRDIVCPVCSRPEINSDEETLTNFFNHIDAILRRMQDKRFHEIFQQKLRDFTLMRLPNFRWCSHCSGGFQFDVVQGNLKMHCPFCNQCTCYKCKKRWEPQHDNATCEQFQQWKEENDPEFQAAGLARHLRENGIDCPDCKFRYALAKGGCMHFKCTQCSHEFCSGCNSPFKHGRKCGKLPSCGNKGLHAHHPRDCLFFLRDYDPDMLRRLLQENNVQYNTQGPNQRTCPVMEQKETPTGLEDDACGREVKPNCAGLCKLHYLEYLVNLVNTHGLDPADVFSIEELIPCLMREDIPVPQRNRESNDAYRNRLLDEVKKLPLKRQAEGNS